MGIFKDGPSPLGPKPGPLHPLTGHKREQGAGPNVSMLPGPTHEGKDVSLVEANSGVKVWLVVNLLHLEGKSC